jgi:hypothetical protein
MRPLSLAFAIGYVQVSTAFHIGVSMHADVINRSSRFLGSGDNVKTIVVASFEHCVFAHGDSPRRVSNTQLGCANRSTGGNSLFATSCAAVTNCSATLV